MDKAKNSIELFSIPQTLEHLYSFAVGSGTETQSMHLGKKRFACTECKKEYNSQEAYKRHYNFYHGKIKKFPCEVCGAHFRDTYQLRGHMASRHDPTLKVTCELCGAKFSYKNDYNIHISQRCSKLCFSKK